MSESKGIVKVALVTGASSGIGLETAKQLAGGGYRVYGLCRREFSHEGITFIRTDITDKAQVLSAAAEIELKEGRLDLLVNNAGFGISGPAELAPLDDVRAQFDVNFFGAVSCVQAMLPLLRQSRGRIVNVSSVAAFVALPFQSYYSASKAAITSFSLALGSELAPFGVTVCAVQPGDVSTGFTSARKKHQPDPVYGERAVRSIERMERDEQKGIPPAAAARAVYKACVRKRNKPVVTPGAFYKLVAVAAKLLPAKTMQKIVAMLYAK